VEVESEGGKQVLFVNGGGSYLSASERRLLMGLGSTTQRAAGHVRWPSGREQVYPDVPGRKWWRLIEGRIRLRPFPAGMHALLLLDGDSQAGMRYCRGDSTFAFTEGPP
jgi:hypothetical protein